MIHEIEMIEELKLVIRAVRRGSWPRKTRSTILRKTVPGVILQRCGTSWHQYLNVHTENHTPVGHISFERRHLVTWGRRFAHHRTREAKPLFSRGVALSKHSRATHWMELLQRTKEIYEPWHSTSSMWPSASLMTSARSYSYNSYNCKYNGQF